MSSAFALKTIAEESECASFCAQYGFRCESSRLQQALNNAFYDYVLLALSEEIETRQQRDRHYQEAVFHLQEATKLLKGQPHPAGNMAPKIAKMAATLQKVITNQSEIAEERAQRFVELNLVRKLRDVWQAYTNTPFYIGFDGSGRSPHDFLRDCFACAARAYPEISWFSAINNRAIDGMIRTIRR